jgi:hypothetical protein
VALWLMVFGAWLPGSSLPAPGLQQAWVYVFETGGGQPWGRFLPGETPYEPGCGPGVSERTPGLLTAQGMPIDTLDLVGWRDGGTWRIVLYAMLAGEPDLEADPACGDSRHRSVVTSVKVSAGGEAVIEAMRRIGARPWRVSVVLR